MRTLLAIVVASVMAFAVLGAPQGVPQGPAQGPPPKNLVKQADGHLSANTEPANTADFEVHPVVTGDTLSGIAASVLKDMRLWPQLWEQNAHIVNPHWIYPGDKVLIRRVTRITEATPPTPVPTPVPEPEPVPPVVERSRVRLVVPPAATNSAPPPQSVINLAPLRNFSEVKASDLYCSGFIRRAVLSTDAKVTAVLQSDPSLLASEGNYISVNRGTSDGVQNGSTWQVLRPTRRVDNTSRALNERDLGMHYLEIAQIRFVLGQANSATARVTQNCEPIEVGDLVVPYTPSQFPALPARRPFSASMTASGQSRGIVVMGKSVLMNSGSAFTGVSVLAGTGEGPLALLERGIAGEGNVVYIDVGRDGARPGDFFIVFRNVEEVLGDGSVLHRRSAIGELVVLKAEERASTALVTYSTDAIQLGDAVEKR